MNDNAPIGIFDSGIGGLTVVKEMMDMMPRENLIYFGDTARTPYGSRPEAEILEFMQQILAFFAAQKVKMAVVACNTMTALGLEWMKTQYSFPLVGVNTGVELAFAAGKCKKAGILATQATIASGSHSRAIRSKDTTVLVYPQACPKLVPLIEREQVQGIEIEQATAEYVLPMKKLAVNVIILGCTHYPFISSVIQKIAGKEIEIIDPAKETAKEAQKILFQKGQVSEECEGKVRLCFSADVERAKRMAEIMFNTEKINFELVTLE
ncbi:glutamate racemase [Pelosinus propionicus]|uniref:Glutamate racemase n=1 Tax=Pelosinus propionicus DSM 13327 TaxID=1123291 RepID=A0A1I4JFQ6_9FIRM|nr:glutamate racemase [Pelosinus propionicus]SFL65033.1 glutamate racemase [Pelosinus propionicus DSM 13327]